MSTLARRLTLKVISIVIHSPTDFPMPLSSRVSCFRPFAVMSLAGGSVLLLGAGFTIAQNFGDARHGATLARHLCAECHAVAPGENSQNPAAPTFEAIATTRGMVGLALEAALQTTHREMPNIMLSSADRADIIAYVESLNTKK